MKKESIDSVDLYSRYALVRNLLIRSRRDDDPVRVSITSGVKDVTDEGDFANPSKASIRKAIATFQKLPEPEQVSILNGWSPDVLKIDRDGYEQTVAQRPLQPCLRMETGRRAGVIAELGETHDEDPDIATLRIKAGSKKADVLNALDTLRRQVDEHWDKLITNPLGLIGEDSKTTPYETDPSFDGMTIVTGRDVWQVVVGEEDLIAIGGEQDKVLGSEDNADVVVVDPKSRRIMAGENFSHGGMMKAIGHAIEISLGCTTLT